MAPGTKSPLTHEFTLSYGANLLKGRGYGEVTYVARVTHDLIEDFQTLQGGFTNVVVNGVPAGEFTNIIYQNTDLANRQYQALAFQARYRIARTWTINGHYTLQLKNYGNYEGEGTNQPGKVSLIGNYPEAFSAAQNFPEGNLQDFQRHRLRIWSVKQWNMSRGGDLSVSGLWRVDWRPRVQSGGEKPAADCDAGCDPRECRLSGRRWDPPDRLLRRSRHTDVPGLRCVRHLSQLQRSGVPQAAALCEVRHLQPVQQREAHRLEHDGEPEQGGAGWTVSDWRLPTRQPRRLEPRPATRVTNLNESNINTYPLAYNGATPGGRTFQMAVGFRF